MPRTIELVQRVLSWFGICCGIGSHRGTCLTYDHFYHTYLQGRICEHWRGTWNTRGLQLKVAILQHTGFVLLQNNRKYVNISISIYIYIWSNGRSYLHPNRSLSEFYSPWNDEWRLRDWLSCILSKNITKDTMQSNWNRMPRQQAPVLWGRWMNLRKSSLRIAASSSRA